jgi:predicted transcriptional regulator
MSITKAAFADLLGVSRPTISSYCKRDWIKDNIRVQTGARGLGGRVAAETDEDFEDADDSAARLLKARADIAEITAERLKGGTEDVVRLGQMRTMAHHAWWAFQRHSYSGFMPTLTAGTGVTDKLAWHQMSLAVLQRDKEIMRDVETVIQAGIDGLLDPVPGTGSWDGGPNQPLPQAKKDDTFTTAEVTEALKAECAVMRDRLLEMPANLAPRLAELNDPKKIAHAIYAEVRQALTELSQ